MKVVTVITDPDQRNYQRFLKVSCDYNGIDLITLVTKNRLKTNMVDRLMGRLWGRSCGFQLKDEVLLEYLSGLPDEEIMMFVDGYDTVFISGQDEILNKWQAFDHPLVFSAELNCHPDKSLMPHFSEMSGPARYLNGGAMIGRVDALR